MKTQHNELSISNNTTLLPQVLGRIKLSNFIALPENKFHKIIKEIEETEVFKKFTYPENRKTKIISYKKYTNTTFNKKFCELKDEIIFDSSNPDIQKVLAENPEVVDKIKSMGLDNFTKYFISSDNDFGLKQISEICKLKTEEARQVIDFVNTIFAMEEFCQPASQRKIKTGDMVYPQFTCVAKINQSGKNCSIEFLSLNYFRGRYFINYKRLSELKTNGQLSKNELREINKLIKKLELVNARKTILYQVILKIVQNQSDYLISGKLPDLKQYTQKMLAKNMGISPGSISRVLNHKSIRTPWDEEKSLRLFLPNEKQTRKELIKSVFIKDGGKSDRIIAEEVRQKYGIILARRTICQYRKEISRSR